MEDKRDKKRAVAQYALYACEENTLRVKETDTFQGVSFSFAIFPGRMYGLFDEMHLDVNGYLMILQSVEY